MPHPGIVYYFMLLSKPYKVHRVCHFIVAIVTEVKLRLLYHSNRLPIVVYNPVMEEGGGEDEEEGSC